MARRLTGGAWLLSLALLAGLATVLSCAHPMPPGGGPPDETPPWLTQAWPESAATGQGEVTELRFTFSEKMDRQDAFRWLRLYPRRTFRSTRWHGSQTAVVQLETALPPDSVAVVELLPGMKDNHGVPQPSGRMWPFATGDTLPTGVIEGSLVLENKPLIGGVVELLPDGPDTVRLQQRPVLRRARTDSTGTYRLAWLPKIGDGWLLRTYDTLRLSPDAPRLDLGLRTLYQPTTPGTLEGELEERPAAPGPIFAFLQTIAEEDTGFVPRPQPPAGGPNQAVPDTGRFTLTEAGPGLVRAIFFVDRDGDSLFSAIPVPEDTLWTLEPWAMVDSVQVEPGLRAALPAPVWPDTLTPWSAPILPDTTIAAWPDTLAPAWPDTLAPAAADTLGPSSAPPPGQAPADTARTDPPKE